MQMQKDQVHLAVPGGEAKSVPPPSHTRGPWHYVAWDQETHSAWRVLGAVNGNYIVADVLNSNESPQNAANVRLIAAAPELLAALRVARQLLAAAIDLPVEQCIGGEFFQINEAIRKAEGA